MKIQDLKEEDIISCPTKAEYDKVLEIAHYANFKWKDKTSFLKENDSWYKYKENTFISILDGTYGDINHYNKFKEAIDNSPIKISTKVINAEDFILDNILDLPTLKKNYKEPERIVFKDKEWLYCNGLRYPFIIKYKSGGNDENFKFYEQYGIDKGNIFGELDELFDEESNADMYQNKATEEQLTKMLGKVAKLKGYKVGKEITTPSNSSIQPNEEVTILNKERVYNMETDELSLGGIIVYSKGEWAKLKKPLKTQNTRDFKSILLEKLIRERR